MNSLFSTGLKSRRYEQFPGFFLTLEGPDGSGKTTMIPIIKEALETVGITPIIVRQPGGSPFAEKVRQLVLGTEDTGEPIQGISEALLFAAARSQCLESVVKPAMRAGHLVIADRWYDSNYAYQGTGRGMLAEVEMLEEMVEGSFMPSCTLFLNVPLGAAQARLAGRTKEFNRMNAEQMEFKRRTWEGYQQRLELFRGRMVEINADRPQDDVKNAVTQFTLNRLVPAYLANRGYLEAHKNLFQRLEIGQHDTLKGLLSS